MNNKLPTTLLSILILSAVIWLLIIARSGHVIGYVSHKFRFDLLYQGEQSDSWGDFSISGKSPSQFTTNRKNAPPFQTVKLEWIFKLNDHETVEGSHIIDLEKKVIETGQGQIPLNQSNLAHLLHLPADYGSADHLAQSLLDILSDCHEGKIPPPSHHNYTKLQTPPFHSTFKHFTTGPTLAVGPTTAWIIILSLPLIGWKFRKYWFK
ncbi:hypothetical protein SAMN02745181_2413 [Rubritalea squalenifaciens DSM 18772]|uniref:Uncharacterized protein n=1 Tax=Rubritalea squalenifaciens DSM 18772 TaxID=1123071 RepID=A0A1M6LJE8_9BACT|nr:hypothetical protein [Rubritalea squalenifaciens]SHJ71302.1 hypothetical protein SAMN02745181_2413 [Rubritalea squalenifaciens DSM 18772]